MILFCFLIIYLMSLEHLTKKHEQSILSKSKVDSDIELDESSNSEINEHSQGILVFLTTFLQI